MSELERVKVALKAHGWSWHGANGTASGKRDMLLNADAYSVMTDELLHAAGEGMVKG